MAGSAGQIVWGDWLLKGEAAIVRDRSFALQPDREITRTDWLFGVEYAAWENTHLIAELLYQDHHGFDNRVAGFPDFAIDHQTQAILFLRHSFLHHTLHAQSLFYASEEMGQFQRIWLEYDWLDGVTVVVGLVNYEDGDHPFASEITDNDKVFFRLEWDL